MASGIRDGKTIRYDDFAGLEVPVPPVKTASAIAALLDRKTAAIDALLAAKERQIELLQEKRQALISQAVTKGLDPNAPMKDSGVEWIGMTPRHWNVLALKHSVNEIIDCKNRTPDYVEDGTFAVVRTSNIRGGAFVEDDLLFTNEHQYREWTRRGVPRRRVCEEAVASGRPFRRDLWAFRPSWPRHS